MSSAGSFSFELSPPRTPEAAEKLPAVIARLAELQPKYFSVTYGAGGSTLEGTYETIMSASAPGEFHYANELVSFIREKHGDHFLIEVAAYPEMHPQAENPTKDFENFCRKVRAGADSALTQLFYNADSYFHFVDRCVKAGITIPIVPGIMPITGFANTTRFCNGCGADLPRWIRLRLEELENDKAALQDFGTEVVTRLCEALLRGGAPGLHFYTINQVGPTMRLWKNLALPVTA